VVDAGVGRGIGAVETRLGLAAVDVEGGVGVRRRVRIQRAVGGEREDRAVVVALDHANLLEGARAGVGIVSIEAVNARLAGRNLHALQLEIQTVFVNDFVFGGKQVAAVLGGGGGRRDRGRERAGVKVDDG